MLERPCLVCRDDRGGVAEEGTHGGNSGGERIPVRDRLQPCRKATLLDQVLGRFVPGANLDQLLGGSMCLAEMCAEAALPLVNLKHGWRPFLDDRCV